VILESTKFYCEVVNHALSLGTFKTSALTSDAIETSQKSEAIVTEAMKVDPDRKVTLLFLLPDYSKLSKGAKEAHLHIEYKHLVTSHIANTANSEPLSPYDSQLESSMSSIINTFNCRVPLFIPKVSYEIDLECDDAACIGEFVSFAFAIWLDEEVENGIELQYEIINIDNTFWLLSGPTKRSFYLKYGEKQNFSFKIVPITTGFLPVPQVQISHKLDILGIHLSKQVHVYPPNTLFLNLQ